MRWGWLIALLMVIGLIPALATSVTPGSLAQEATPPASPQAEEEVFARVVAAGSVQILSPGTAFISMGRITIPPGAVVSFDPNDPNAVLFYVSAGELTFQVSAPMEVTRRIEPGTPVPGGPEEVAADTPFTLLDGESALFPPALSGEVRNDGSEDASAWIVNLAHQPADAATPTP
jgi:quercetin dioxygenase-like cupin family protein